MGTRFGFMESNKPGKCFYCKEEIIPGQRCGFDNNVKRRTCTSCAERMIADGSVEITVKEADKPKSRLFNKDDPDRVESLTAKFNELSDRFDALMKRIDEQLGAVE